MKSFNEYLEEAVNAKASAALKVGDVLVATYGHNMTINTFYKVVAMTPSGKSVKIAELGKKFVSGDGMRGDVVATQEVTGKPITKRISTTYNGKPAVVISRYEVAFLWDGKPRDEDHYD